MLEGFWVDEDINQNWKGKKEKSEVPSLRGREQGQVRQGDLVGGRLEPGRKGERNKKPTGVGRNEEI